MTAQHEQEIIFAFERTEAKFAAESFRSMWKSCENYLKIRIVHLSDQ